METKRFEELFRNEFQANRFFEKYIWKSSWRRCVFCRTTRPYLLGSGRWRCRSCHRDFRSWNGRWLERVRIKAHQWCRVLKLFEEEILPLPASRKLGLSYPTVLKAYHTIRWSLLPTPMTDVYPLKTGEASHLTPIFSLIQREGKVHFSNIRKVTPRSLLRRKLKMECFGNVVFTEKFLNYDSLIFWGSRNFPIQISKEGQGAGEAAGEGDGFHSFARLRFLRHHGISQKLFPLYLGEMVFRYNHRGENLFHLLASRLSQSVAGLL